MATLMVETERSVRVVEAVPDASAEKAQHVDCGRKLLSVGGLYLSEDGLVTFEGQLVCGNACRGLTAPPRTLDEAFERAHDSEGLLSVRLNGVCLWSWEAVLAKRAAVAKAREKAARASAAASRPS